MNNDPLLRESKDAELAARLARMTARSPRASSRTTAPPSAPPSSPSSTRSSTAPSSPPPPPPPGAAPVRKKRRHPARHSRSAALALSFLTTSGLAYAFASTDTGASANVAAPAGIVTPTPAVTAAPSSAPTVTVPVSPATTASPTTAAPTTAAPAPTVVNGASFGNRYGDVQVQATFAADGSLTNVDVLQVPYRDGKSVSINNYAVPRLNSEALTAQSANVHTVSGATYTSIGYEQSLQSAIDAARANGITTIS